MRSVMRAGALTVALAIGHGEVTAQSRSYNWHGLYVGGHGSAFSAGTEYTNPATPEQSLQGAMLGAQIGYNWQTGNFVLGAEADISFGRLEEFIRDGNFLTQSGSIERMASIRGRLGYAFDNIMPYLTAGVIWTRLEQGSACPQAAPFGVCAVTGPFNVKSTETFQGWVIGGGVEWGIARHWSIKGEALFGRFGDERYTGTIPNVGTVVVPVGLNLDSILRVGVNYRF